MMHDYDDYLFAGHTGHSAVHASLAIAELLRAEGSPMDGQDFITTVAIANELGGRLGASMLFGPHNGQMWSYIHLLSASAAASRALGLDTDGIESAIGIAFNQPNYPLVATFMGSDAKALIAAQPTTDAVRAAILSAEGVKGARNILEDRGGFWARFYPDAMAKMFSGFGTAWLTESLSYKIYPGCAYIDTAIDALSSILRQYEAEVGDHLTPADVKEIVVEATMLTAGMETMSGWYRSEHISPMNLNFSVALSGAVMILAGKLTPEQLEPAFYLERENEILDLGKKWRIENSAAMTAAIAPENTTLDLRKILRKPDNALEGEDFSAYQSRFPARVTLTSSSGRTFSETCKIPLGGAGRALDETSELVKSKLSKSLALAGMENHFSEIMNGIATLEAVDEVLGEFWSIAGV